MLAASSRASSSPASRRPGGSPIPTLVGVARGRVLDRADGLVPHAHYLLTGSRRSDAANPSQDLAVDESNLAGVVLFILAITLHNIPRGWPLGSASARPPATRSRRRALSLMLAIGIQNIPEGLAVSIAAVNAGFGTRPTRRSRASAPASWRFRSPSSARGRRDRRTAPALCGGLCGGRDAGRDARPRSPRDAPLAYERVATRGLFGVIVCCIQSRACA